MVWFDSHPSCDDTQH